MIRAIIAMIIAACWAGRRPRQIYIDQTINVDDADAVGGDICCDDNCDDGCASDSDDNSSSSENPQ